MKYGKIYRNDFGCEVAFNQEGEYVRINIDHGVYWRKDDLVWLKKKLKQVIEKLENGE